MNNKPGVIIFLLSTLSFNCCLGQVTENIRLNQVGFYPNSGKIAIVTGIPSPNKFYVVNVASHDTVYSAALEDTITSAWSSAVTRIANFSSVNKTGTYTIYIPGLGNSYPFRIGPNVLHGAAIASLKGFYFQRVSMPLDAAYAGQWARPAGHPDTEVLIHPSAASDKRPTGTIISTPGGWYDAGDYNKYIVNSGITMGTLLSAYEDFSNYFDTLKTNIPESNDAIPDILNEIIYNLRWMLSMQDPYDGGVYNKCTNAAFDGMVMPGVTKLPRYVVQKGTAATLDFAAVAAQAARILKKFNRHLPGLADSCKIAAEKAWQWALLNPNVSYNQNAINSKFEPKITTGGYGDFNFSDEWFWASCELLVTTHGKQYTDTIIHRWNANITLPSWNNVQTLGFYTLLRNKSSYSMLPGLSYDSAKTVLTGLAEKVSHGGDKAYQSIIGTNRFDFVWGSNSVAMNQSLLLINAYLATRQTRYLNEAMKNVDYILGRNATGYSFITGIGSKSTMHPHHRQSVSDGIVEPVPGLLAGGPNPGQQDRCPGYPSKMPAESYLDSDCAYASNEIAINWNAPLVYVLNAMEALRKSR